MHIFNLKLTKTDTSTTYNNTSRANIYLTCNSITLTLFIFNLTSLKYYFPLLQIYFSTCIQGTLHTYIHLHVKAK